MLSHKYSLWILKSINLHFAGLLNRHVYYEGANRDTESLSEWFEVRIDGPSIKQLTRGQFRANVEVNILCIAVNGPNRMYLLRQMLAEAAEAMKTDILIKRYGDINEDPDNDRSLIGCLELLKTPKDDIDIAYFGRVQPQTEMQQGSAEARYRIYLGV